MAYLRLLTIGEKLKSKFGNDSTDSEIARNTMRALTLREIIVHFVARLWSFLARCRLILRPNNLECAYQMRGIPVSRTTCVLCVQIIPLHNPALFAMLHEIGIFQCVVTLFLFLMIMKIRMPYNPNTSLRNTREKHAKRKPRKMKGARPVWVHFWK